MVRHSSLLIRGSTTAMACLVIPLTPPMQYGYIPNVLQIMKPMKRKRKSGAGRKPAGPFAHTAAQLTIRMPEDLRRQLEQSSTKKGWSLTQELLWHLDSSYKRQ